jgi:outer membrane protein assembly factor BamD (BamD/ComL family)
LQLRRFGADTQVCPYAIHFLVRLAYRNGCGYDLKEIDFGKYFGRIVHVFGGHMAKAFYASLLALLLSTSGALFNAYSQSINAETNSVLLSPSEEEALKEAAELIRQSRHGSEGLVAAERGLAQLLEAYRDSTIAPLLYALLDGAREKLAEKDLSIAMFYMYKRSAYRAAEGRLEGIKSEYPNYSRLDEVSYQLALLQIETGRRAEAEDTLQGLLNQHKFSPRARDAQDKIEALRSGR